MIVIEGIIKCSTSFKMRAIALKIVVACIHVYFLDNNIMFCKSIWKFPIVITLEEEPYTVAKPDVL